MMDDGVSLILFRFFFPFLFLFLFLFFFFSFSFSLPSWSFFSLLFFAFFFSHPFSRTAASATNRYILMRCAPTHILVDLKSTNRDPGALMNMRNVCEKLSIMQEVSNSQDTLVAMGGLGNATNTGDGHKSARKLNRKKNRYIRGLQKQGQLFPTAHDGTTINRTFSKEKSGTVGKQWFTIQKSAIKVKNEQRAKYAAAAAIKVETSSSSSSKSDSKKRNAATSGQSSNKKQRGSKKMV